MKKQPKDKYEALEAVKAAIRERPERFDMKSWCGTPCCIAGWLQNLFGPHNEHSSVEAGRLLGGPLLDGNNEYGRLGDLFFMGSWPEVFFEMYVRADSRKEKVEAACMAIDDWMVLEKQLDARST